MASWGEFETEAPGLARAVRKRLEAVVKTGGVQVTAAILGPDDRLARQRILLQIDMLGRAVSLEIDGSLLDVI